MNPSIRRKLAKQERRITRRLAKARKLEDSGRPVLRRGRARYEVAERTQATAHGGIGAVHDLVLGTGLAAEIDARLNLLKVHRPYHESDHVLNIAYNSICGGQTLDDIELRRNDEAFLDALGVGAIPDPTTAGDFCRRFAPPHVEALMDGINAARLKVWKRQGSAFVSKTARIDADGSIVPTAGECKEGMALSYKGIWGYHPLLISFANTREPLYIVNRGGNRPSAEGAAAYLDKGVALCREAGFTDVLLRGDTDFSQTTHLDRWTDDGVRFVFGYDLRASMKERADDVEPQLFTELVRRAKRAFVAEDKRRAEQPRIKEEFVRLKGYKNIRLRSEDVAEFDHRPTACKTTYRMVVLRKNLTVQRGEEAMFDDIRYFLYITNDRALTATQVVFEANDRCNQENLIEQLKNGVRALHAPANTLNANWAYMVMASLAWSIKAWMALSLPIQPRWRQKHEAERDRWLQMEFRTFRNAVIDVPAQVVRTGRRLIIRLLAWRPELPVLFRLPDPW
ncbi:MAG: IS1380 family transposase [Chloroflexi bacterium]|nr:IS1380 family transposase [Chloroflexota bacterium]